MQFGKLFVYIASGTQNKIDTLWHFFATDN